MPEGAEGGGGRGAEGAGFFRILRRLLGLRLHANSPNGAGPKAPRAARRRAFRERARARKAPEGAAASSELNGRARAQSMARYAPLAVVDTLVGAFFPRRGLRPTGRRGAATPPPPTPDDVLSEMTNSGYFRLDARRELPRGARDLVTVLVLSGDSRLSHNVPDLRALLERTLDRASAERLDELLVVADDQFFERRQLFELVRAQGAGNEPPPGGDPAGLAAFFSVRPYCNFVTVVPDNAVVPRHRVLPPAEFAALRLARETLPVVFDSDPPVVWEGGRAGQVVEITRDSQPNVVELAYRRIEAAP